MQRWLERRSASFGALLARRLTRIINGAYQAFLDSLPSPDALTASGDFSEFDRIPGLWAEVVDEDLLPFLNDAYVIGAQQSFGSSPLAREMPEQRAVAWTRVVNDQAAVYLASSRNRLVGVGDAVYRHIAEQTATAVRSGASNEALKDQIERNTRFSEYRADTIARTEIVGAYVNGDWAGAQALDEFGPAEKFWQATADARARPEHLALDGETVPFDEPFDVGGEPMMYPHEDGASAANVVNCRCVVGFLYVGDERPDGTIVGAEEIEQAMAAAQDLADDEEAGSFADEALQETVRGDYGPGEKGVLSPVDAVSLPTNVVRSQAPHLTAVETTLDEIAKLHGVAADRVATTTVKLTKNDGPTPRGSFKTTTTPGDPNTITVATSPSAPAGFTESAFVHEFGHRLDFNGRAFRSELDFRTGMDQLVVRHGPLRWAEHIDELPDGIQRETLRLMEAYKRSDAYAALQASAPEDISFFIYHSSPAEVWARAYQGWVPRASGMSHVVEAEREMRSLFLFSDRDMETVGPIVERILRMRGLMR